MPQDREIEAGSSSRGAAGARLAIGLSALFAAALALRLTLLWETWRSRFTPAVYLPIDARDYHLWALQWLRGEWPPAEPFFRPPLYPLFLGSTYALFGASPLGPLVVQALLGAASCLLAFGIARELFEDRRVAWLAGAACAACGPLVYFDAQLLSGSLDVFFELAALWLLLRAARLPGVLPWGFAGAAIGLSALNRGAILLLLPVLALWLPALPGWRPGAARPSPRQRLRFALPRGAALLAPLVLALLPVAWHNARYDEPPQARTPSATVRALLSGRFVALASNSGLNFYLGNHAVLREINRLDHPDHMAVYDRIRQEPAQRGIHSARDANDYLVRETLREIAARPADWLRLIGSKLVEVVNGVEIGRNTSPYADRRDSVVLRLLLWREAVAFPTGLLVPLGFAGIALCRRAWRLHLIVWAALATQVVFLLAFFVASRYRLPMLPLLAIYSAHAGVTLVDRIRRDEGAAAGRLAGGIALLALIANVRAVPAPDRHHFVDHFNLAVAYRDRGDFATAAAEFRTALALDPEDPKLLQALCEVLSVGEPGQEAVAVCTRAAGFDPASAALQYRAGQALEASGRLVEAGAYYRRAALIEPDSALFEAAWKRARAAGASADSGGP